MPISAPEDAPSGEADRYTAPATSRSSELYLSSNAQHEALHTAGIHRDNAKATLQILALDGADRRAILADVARSLARAELELRRAHRGSICGDAHGKTAVYDYDEIQEDIAELRRNIMRQLHELSPVERTPILNILNPPFELLQR